MLSARSTTPQPATQQKHVEAGALARVCSFRGAGVLRVACCMLLGVHVATLAVGSVSAVRRIVLALPRQIRLVSVRVSLSHFHRQVLRVVNEIARNLKDAQPHERGGQRRLNLDSPVRLLREERRELCSPAEQ